MTKKGFIIVAGEFALSSNYLADSGSLASGFEGAALGGAEAFNIIGVLEANDGVTLSANPTFSDLLTGYKQAVAFGNRDRMRQFGAEIARIIREHASAFNRLLGTLPRESTHESTRRFGSATEALAHISPAFLPTHRVELHPSPNPQIKASASGVRDNAGPRPAAEEDPSVESGPSAPVAEFPLPAPVAQVPTPAVSAGTLSFQDIEKKNNYYDADFVASAGEATVYRVKDAGGKTFAAKVSHKSFKTAEEAKPFAREVQALTRVDHPNVVKCYNAFVERDARLGTFKVVLIMEWVEGETLKIAVESTRRKNPFSEAEILEIWRQTDAGLQAMHDADVVHRDIKPSNVMIGHDETGHVRVKILDAGVAKLMELDTHTESRGIGSLQTMAPEQRGGDPDLPEKYRAKVGAWSDIYSEGLLVLYLATHGELQREFSDARRLLQRIDKFFPKDRFTPAFVETMKAHLDPDPEVRMKARRKLVAIPSPLVGEGQGEGTANAAEAPATVAMVSAAQYLEGLRADTREPADSLLSSLRLSEARGDRLPELEWNGISGAGLLISDVFYEPANLFQNTTWSHWPLLGLALAFLAHNEYKIIKLRKPREYVRLNPPALYNRKTGEVLAPTFERFRQQGAVPLYPVDKNEDIDALPVGSHVLLRNVPIGEVTKIVRAHNLKASGFSFWLNFSGKIEDLRRYAYYPGNEEETKIRIQRLRHAGHVIGVIEPDKKLGTRIRIIRIKTDPEVKSSARVTPEKTGQAITATVARDFPALPESARRSQLLVQGTSMGYGLDPPPWPSVEFVTGRHRPPAPQTAEVVGTIVGLTPTIPATAAMVGAAQYLEELKEKSDELVDRSAPDQNESDPFVPIGVIVGGVLLFSSPLGNIFSYVFLTLGSLLLGYRGYKLHQYGKLNPPALYNRKTGEVLAPTLARFKKGAVPLYPVDKKEDIDALPIGSHVLSKNIPIRNITIDKDDFHISCWLDFSGKNDENRFLAYYYDAKSMEEAVAVAEKLGQEGVTLVGTIIEEVLVYLTDTIRAIRIVSIDPHLPH